LSLTGCGYNDFQRLDEQSKAAWSEVLNQYQRRADLVPNIVATVKGEANFEQETLTKVIEARAKATSIQVTPETLNNPEAFNKFQAAQGELGSALSAADGGVEQYPNLKANQASRPAGSRWKAPRTASPWRATVTSRRSRSTTCWRAAFPPI
jgi:LemA protein